jgi:hypothetical protein
VCRQHLEDFGRAPRTDVMSFVDDDEAELIADPWHPRDRARVRRDGDRLDAMIAVADAPDRVRRERRERFHPLVEEHARRHDDERTDAELLDRRECDERLSRAGG